MCIRDSWLPIPRLEVTLGHRTPEERTVQIRVIGSDGASADPLLAQLEGLLTALSAPGAISGLVATDLGASAEPPGVPGVG